jgi:MinD-like ATPase involved in chromosome partitioning or flagellar assembly
METKIFFVAGNEKPHLISLFLENLLFYKNKKQEPSLFIDTNRGISFTSRPKQKVKEKELRMYDYYPDFDIISITFEKLINLAGNGKYEDFFKTEAHFSDFFIYDEINTNTINLLSLSDYLLFIVKNDTYSSGYLYNILKQLKAKNIYKKILVIVSEAKSIEEAANVFVRLKAEIEDMLQERLDAVFAGFLRINTKRLYYSLQKSQPYIKTFPSSKLCGLIKFINDKLKNLENYLHDQSLYKALAESVSYKKRRQHY